MVFGTDITITLNAINNINKPVLAGAAALKKLEMQTQAYQNVATNANISLRETQKHFRENNLVMQDASTAINTLTGRTQNLGQVADAAGRSAKRFNFSWLSVMFAGMALNRVFGGLIKSQMELFGITELFGGVLTLVMLPVMELLLPLFLLLAEVLMNLSPEAKIITGIFIVMGAVFGILMLVIGQFMLAVMGLAGIFGLSMGAAAASMLGVVIIIVGIGLIIAGIIIIIKNWGKNWAAVAKGIVLVLGGIAIAIIGIMVLMGLIPIAWALVGILIVVAVVALAFAIIKNWDKIVDSLKIAWAVIKNTFLKGGNAIVELFGKVINKIIGWINKIPGVKLELIDVSRFKKELTDIDALRERLSKQREEQTKAKEMTQVGKPIFKSESQTGGFLDVLPDKFKGIIQSNNLAGSTQIINVENNNNITVLDKEELEKMLNDNNLKIVEDIKRQIAI